MRSISLAALVVLLTVSFVPAQDKDKAADFKVIDAMIEKALDAYNKEDPKAFFADYSKDLKDVATSAFFKTLYVDKYKKDFGNYASRKFVKEMSVLTGDVLLVTYEGEFAKAKPVLIQANFKKEGDGYKVLQIQFNKK